MDLPKTSVIRLARMAGVKTISEDCVNLLMEIVGKKVRNIIRSVVIVCRQKGGKMLTEQDLIHALALQGIYLCESSDLGSTVYTTG